MDKNINPDLIKRKIHEKELKLSIPFSQDC